MIPEVEMVALTFDMVNLEAEVCSFWTSIVTSSMGTDELSAVYSQIHLQKLQLLDHYLLRGLLHRHLEVK